MSLLVDEDPGSTKSSYEKSLKFVDEKYGIIYFSDRNDNKVFILSGKLENWIIDICNNAKIKPPDFGLPMKSDDLHDVIDQRIAQFSKLTDELIRQKNPG